MDRCCQYRREPRRAEIGANDVAQDGDPQLDGETQEHVTGIPIEEQEPDDQDRLRGMEQRSGAIGAEAKWVGFAAVRGLLQGRHATEVSAVAQVPSNPLEDCAPGWREGLAGPRPRQGHSRWSDLRNLALPRAALPTSTPTSDHGTLRTTIVPLTRVFVSGSIAWE